MANWTKDGFVGRMFQTIGQFIAPPGMPSPLLWGDETTVRQRFGDAVSDLRLRRVQYPFDYPFPPDGNVAAPDGSKSERRLHGGHQRPCTGR